MAQASFEPGTSRSRVLRSAAAPHWLDNVGIIIIIIVMMMMMMIYYVYLVYRPGEEIYPVQRLLSERSCIINTPFTTGGRRSTGLLRCPAWTYSPALYVTVDIVRRRKIVFQRDILMKDVVETSEGLDHTERASTRFMVASRVVLSEVYGHDGPGVCLGDGQTEAYLKDMGMAGLASAWTMARRRSI